MSLIEIYQHWYLTWYNRVNHYITDEQYADRLAALRIELEFVDEPKGTP